MERYKSLKLKGLKDTLKSYEEALFCAITQDNEWKVRKVKGYPLSNSGGENDVLCIETPAIFIGDETITAVIWIRYIDGNLEVINIVPISTNHLECVQYNYILDKFRDKFLLPLKEQYNIEIEESKPYFDMREVLGDEAMEKLLFFSSMANKSTGCSHPLDMKRWLDFIESVHKNHKHLSADDLMHWLEENGWFEDVAYDLSLKFDYGISLLEHYDDNRTS